MKIGFARASLLAACVLYGTVAHAEIKIGIDFGKGPGSALGQPQLKTVAALPKEIGGEKVTYIVLATSRIPTKGVQNARRLVIQDKVDVLVGPR